MENDQKVNWSRVLILAGAVIAFTIGSGFATGQEIIQYFTAYGVQGILTILLFAVCFIYYNYNFAKAGADIITFHLESDSDPDATIQEIHQLGCKAGISIKPNTPAELVKPYLDRVEMVLVMTVEPGFGGQKFMTDMMDKVRSIRSWIEQSGREIDLQVDGGVNQETAKICIEAGANVLVAGSYLFSKEDYAAAMRTLLPAD